MIVSRKFMMCFAAMTLVILFMGGSCPKGDTGAVGKTGPVGPPAAPPPTNTALTKFDNLPGVVITVTSVTGASGAGGAFQVGDKPKVTFTVKKKSGVALPLSELDSGAIFASGPTFNYAPIYYSNSNLRTAAVQNSDGSYSYTFATGIPATYLAPLNDTASFGAADGELQGQALLSGTYTIGITAYKNYTVDGVSYRDAADSVTSDFFFGTASTIDKREAVKASNCNQCHVRIQAHGGSRANNVTLCLLCHTAGAEDKNVASAAGGTPGVTIEFKSMIHKIHMGEHLPSVNGVGVTAGVADYTVTPKPFQIVGFNNSVNDFSDVAFPAWPNLNVAMPRNDGYGALTAAAKAQDDQIRKGPSNCNLCHGDPDGAGALTAPSQGTISYTQPTRRACGACHDDVDFTKPYVKNGLTMPAQANDSNCITCHLASGTATAGLPPTTPEAHVHPLFNTTFNPGLQFNVSGFAEAGTNNGNGKIDPGEKIALTFTLTNDDGSTPVLPSALASASVVINGPNDNRNIVIYATLPPAGITGTSPYTVNVPEPVLTDFSGTAANDAAIETFTTPRAPHWNVTGALDIVRLRTATGAVTTAAVAVKKDTNWVDVASATGFANNDYAVIDDGTAGREYKLVGYVDTTLNRIWFKANSYGQQSGFKAAHAAGCTVAKVTLTTDYTVNAATGQITEAAVASFPAGQDVVVSYTTDFVMPTTYGPSLDNSDFYNDNIGKWTGLPIAPGTYSLDVWGYISRVWSSPDALAADQTTYRGTSPAAISNFLVGTATTVESYTNIAAANCNRCHVEVFFHGGGRRGFDTCFMCHTTTGFEDAPKWANNANAATPGALFEFRSYAHEIHRGADLYYNPTEVEFPAMPQGVKDCAVCHGTGTIYHAPTNREHPTAQVNAIKPYSPSCRGCHDDPSTAAHVNLMTASNGGEACGVCHGDGADYSVTTMHKVRP
ncbi:MAG TPA: hypothetical protein VL860_03370 [Planctomycetota bacterium]|nr:hypothetical protein [Planctomycetota bacterium]